MLERIEDTQYIYAQLKASKRIKCGHKLEFPHHICFEVISRNNQFYRLRYSQIANDNIRIFPTALGAIEAIGEIPLPPYLHRNPEKQDNECYQTVYAKHKGSVAAPTAGLHFD